MRLLEPVDLLFHIRLGQACLLGCLDPADRHVPHWLCGFNHGRVTEFQYHGCWDLCHNIGRALHALSMAEEVTGDHVDESVIADLSYHLFALFDRDEGLPGTMDNNTGKYFSHLHNVREVTHGLTALIRRGSDRAASLAERMIHLVWQAVDETGRIHLDRLPPSIEANEKYTNHPHQEGRAVDALVRYYRVTGNPEALDLAGRMTRFALDHCFTPAGTLTPRAGTHGHSINALVAGMADLALVTHDAGLLQRVKEIFDVGLPCFNSSFGWSNETVGGHLRGESNNTGDLLRAALCLGRAESFDYFERAERILRGHLLPSQVIDVDKGSDTPGENDEARRRLVSRIRGGFSFPLPNDLLYQPDAPIVTYDVTSGAVDALCETYKNIWTEDSAGLHVNLLITSKHKDARMKSFLSGQGRIELECPAGRNVFVRIPTWVSRCDLRLTVNGTNCPPTFVGPRLLIAEKPERQSVTLEFPVPERREVESVDGREYTTLWRGDQITAMSPSGTYLPMFPPCTT
jgi:hypothetical protein